jgi:hypothetical protein
LAKVTDRLAFTSEEIGQITAIEAAREENRRKKL